MNNKFASKALATAVMAGYSELVEKICQTLRLQASVASEACIHIGLHMGKSITLATVGASSDREVAKHAFTSLGNASLDQFELGNNELAVVLSFMADIGLANVPIAALEGIEAPVPDGPLSQRVLALLTRIEEMVTRHRANVDVKVTGPVN